VEMINGVLIKPLKIISDERGSIMHMMRVDDPDFEKFGEIYFSTIYPGIIKGWHIHKEMILNYAVIKGMIKLVLYDDRNESPTKGELQEIYIGEKNYCLVKIPPKIWNGFKAIGNEMAIVANLASIAHQQDEIERLDPFSNKIPYKWGLEKK